VKRGRRGEEGFIGDWVHWAEKREEGALGIGFIGRRRGKRVHWGLGSLGGEFEQKDAKVAKG
jgi:hypothetical protein